MNKFTGKINLKPETLITVQLVFVLFERFLIQTCGLPGAIIYVLDIMNLVLFLYAWNGKTWKKNSGIIVSYIAIVLLSLIVGVIYYPEWGGNLVSAIIEIRNLARFLIFFIASVTFLDERKCKKIYKIMIVFFFR